VRDRRKGVLGRDGLEPARFDLVELALESRLLLLLVVLVEGRVLALLEIHSSKG
jgi:hypothetical protein